MNREPFRFKNRTFVLHRPLTLPEKDLSGPVSASASASVAPPSAQDLYRPEVSIHNRRHEKPVHDREPGRPDLTATAREMDKGPLRRRKGPPAPRLSFRPKIFIPAFRLRSRATKPRKKRLSWGSSASPDVSGYRLYWAVGRGVDYEAEHADIGKVTTILLPDDIASFPHVSGRVEIGVTALNQHGNESDMMVIAASVDFRAPDPPEDLKLEEA